jgi:hypothetical protein
VDKIERARRLREEYEIALEHADEKRSEYHREIKKIHLSGIPLREIAELLGMSHQRIHQIVGTATPKKLRRGLKGSAAILFLILLTGYAFTTRANQGATETASGAAKLVPSNLALYETPEAAAYAAVVVAYPKLRNPEVKLLFRFPPPSDYDTRVRVRSEDFCRVYAPQETRPGNEYGKNQQRGWVAWGEGMPCLDGFSGST